MVMGARDLDAFATETRAMRIVDDGEASLHGERVIPGRRPDTGDLRYLALHNGVPIGYGLILTVTRRRSRSIPSSFAAAKPQDIRGLLAMLGHLFGTRSISLDPHQLGQERGGRHRRMVVLLLGFRPQAAEARSIMHEELARMK
jgi:hypothetical protein